MSVAVWVQQLPWAVRWCLSRTKDVVIILGGIVMAQLLLSDSVHQDMATALTSRWFVLSTAASILGAIFYVVRSRLGFDQRYFESLGHRYKGGSKPLRYYKGRRKAPHRRRKEADTKGFAHQFYYRRSSMLLRPNYCNVCRLLMSGASTSLCCEICGYCVHEECVHLAKRNCKPIWIPRPAPLELPTSPRRPEGSENGGVLAGSMLGISHHFVEGNHSTVRDMCVVCGLAVGSLLGLGGWHCVWCQDKVHDWCLDQAPKVCTLGQHFRLLVPPCCVKLKNKPTSSDSRRGSKRRGNRKKRWDGSSSSGNIRVDDEVRYEIDVPDWCTPVVVFVNVKSGGRYGERLLHEFLSVLNPLQVFDLGESGPEPGLNIFKNVPRLRVLVCGGDGSASWVLSAIDSIGFDRDPPVSMLPTGTGNDLARVLGWGGGYGGDMVASVLNDVLRAHTTLLDRWDIAVYPADHKSRKTKRHQANSKESTSADAGASDSTPTHRQRPASLKIMTNYFGIGLDGIIATRFHELREGNPLYFGSQILNKLWYGQLGASAYLTPPRDPLKGVCITVDEKQMNLHGLQGVVVLNISSYGGGSDLWGSEASGRDAGGESREGGPEEKDAEFETPSQYDKLVEVVGITDSLHMAKCQVGIASCVRLGQGRKIVIEASKRGGFVAQVDGEPWRVGRDTRVEVSFRKQAAMLSKSRTREDGLLDKIETILMDAEIAKIISGSQHRYLLTRMVKDVAGKR
ncbi:hypothetical protein AAMO2058_000563800 [Amorphochlora amoebiformis]